jgi:hypothetical protein
MMHLAKHKYIWSFLASHFTSVGASPILTRGVSYFGLAIHIKKYLKAKRRNMETQVFHHAKI